MPAEMSRHAMTHPGPQFLYIWSEPGWYAGVAYAAADRPRRATADTPEMFPATSKYPVAVRSLLHRHKFQLSLMQEGVHTW